MSESRFERQIRFFGEEGQKLIRKTHVTVVGVGGVGSHVVQQLAFLGVGHMSLVDPDELEETNRNRLIGSCEGDPIPGTKKVDIAERSVLSVDSTIRITKIADDLLSAEAFSEIRESDFVFGCVDNDGPRLILTELCLAYSKPYLDLATDIVQLDGLDYGGRLCITYEGGGCPYCYDVLTQEEITAYFESPEAKEDRKSVYGVSEEYLNQIGPSVVSINGVIASLAVTEFAVMVTGLRRPNPLLYYRGKMGIVTIGSESPDPSCYFCTSVKGLGRSADVERYLHESNDRS